MTGEMVISIAEKGIYTTLLLSAPILILALGVGLIVSIIQATTQIQEQTLAFVPKIVAVLIGIIYFGPWMIDHMVSYANDIFSNLNRFVG
jgi:flagellar biosynthetic protein FliQ